MERIEIIENFIRNSRSEMQLVALDNRELIATASQFEKRLEPIPTAWLERVFTRVMENHQKRTPIIPAEVMAEWQKLIPAYNREQAQSEDRQACPYSCSVDGWVTVDQSGRIWTGGDGPTYARRCPVHRPAPWQAREISESEYQRSTQNR